MSSNPPRLTDRAALLRNRRRSDPARGMFLQEMAADDIHDRLSMVNREFSSIVIVTGFPDVWRQSFPEAKIISDEDTLPLDPESCDLIIHGLALHWANDPVGQLIQARLALKPDGLLLAASFGGQTLHELRASLAQAETQIRGGLSPRVLPMADIRDLGALLQRAGFALPVTDSHTQTASYATLYDLMRDLRAMGETNALSQRSKLPVSKSLFDAAEQIYREAYAEDERLLATFEFLFLTGWKPDESQQKPLRPGSASARLADALNTKETKI